MLTWLAPILVFGLVVFIHELGHFLAAKSVGVYAPRFSIGFGRPIFRYRRGETEYVIGILAILGGYVRMASREDETMAAIEGGNEEAKAGRSDWDPDAMQPFGPKPVPPNRWFESKPLWARLFILIAGVAMNGLLALAINIGIFAASPRQIPTLAVDSVVAGRPAERAGLLAGDSVVSVDGVPMTVWSDVLDKVRRSPNVALQFEVRRDGTSQRLVVTPDAIPDVEGDTANRVGQIGVLPALETQPVTVGYALREGTRTTWLMGSMVLDVVGGLFSGRVSMTQLGGPIAIAKSSVEAARSGMEVLLSLIAFLSINVAVLNLLPIPILDGGQILLNAIEGARGSAFSARTREYILRAGLLAIALLFAVVMFNDLGLRRLFP
ncbi:MAG: Regulator of sigma-W protease RasP [Gemmatimonadaceae bacterium]|nr:Regulator of sigma-W protease RasP [Gemmatimonadaceae bacterium]